VKFTGQVRVPEVDHPGVPATIVVEEGQTEVFLEGESLGRWSLFDVRAARLVSSAFSLSLDGEEITFIADEPVDFAYKGVDHMAGVWARYKSMTIPRRVVAVGRSRRGTIPSRIPELREAMLLNLQTAGRGASRQATMEVTTTALAEPSPWTKRIDAYSNVPQPIDTEPIETEVVDNEPIDTEPVDTERVHIEPVEVDAVAEPDDAATDLEIVPSAEQPTEGLLVDTLDDSAFAPEIEPAADAIAIENAEPELRVPLRPGPGLIPRRVERPRAEEVGAPFWDEAWEEPPIEEEPYDDLPPDADSLLTLEHLPGEVTEAEVTEEAADGPDVEAVELVAEEDVELAAEEDHPIFADEALTEPGPVLPVVVEETEVEESAIPVSVEQLAVVAATDQASRPQMVVDLDHLHVDQASLEPDLELLFAGAPAPEGEKSGLLGAVRSAFARNKTSHEHEFVEAPGGIGIVRQICAECGYISIGVAD
jgi:hypothetical protein